MEPSASRSQSLTRVALLTLFAGFITYGIVIGVVFVLSPAFLESRRGLVYEKEFYTARVYNASGYMENAIMLRDTTVVTSAVQTTRIMFYTTGAFELFTSILGAAFVIILTFNKQRNFKDHIIHGSSLLVYICFYLTTMAFAPYLFITTPYFLFDLSLIYIPLLHYVSKASLIYLIIWYVVLIVQHLSKRARERKIDVSVIERVGIIAFRVFTILYLIISTTLAIYGIVLTVTSNNFSSFLTLFASLCDLVAAVLCIFIPIAQVCNNRVTVVVLAVVVTLLAGIGMTVQLSLSDIYYREHNTTAHTNATLVYVILCIILKITFFLFAILFTGTIAYIRNDVLSKLWHETKINKADMVIEDPDETETFTDDIKHLIIKVDDISIDGRIAEGSFGVVFGGKYRGSLVAIKKMKRDEEGEEFKHEVKMLNSLRHPNIVLFMGACLGTEFKFIVTEKMATSLDAVLHPKKSTGLHSILSFDQKVQIATDIARAVAYMHARTPPICHRDLKPNQKRTTAKVCDFGSSRNVSTNRMTGNVGTHMYMVCSYLALTQQSPEVLYNRPYTEKCDVYSFGIILYELFFEEKPYDEPANNLFMLGIEITQGKRPSIRYSSTMSSREKEFLILTQQCWDQNANDRPDFAQILKKLEEL